MGALIHYTRDPFRPGVYEVRQTIADITAQDAVRATFPELADAPLTMQRNGRALYADDIIGEGDVIWIAQRPEIIAAAAAGTSFWATVGSYLLQAFIYAAVAYLVSYLTKPKGKKDKAASPAYSVAIDQNAARLSGTIPVQYGRCLAMPDIAAQTYAEFVAHNERVSMILCLGMGTYQIHDIFLGESRVLDFPPGNVLTWVFGPNDHQTTLGNIERITGVAEDMLTIPESAGVDLAAPNDPPEVSTAGSTSGGTLLPDNPAQSQLWIGLVPGRQYVVTNSVGGSATVRYVGMGANNSAVFDGPLPPKPGWVGIDAVAQLTFIDDAQEGGRMGLLYSQKELWDLQIGEIIFVQNAAGQRFGPFEVARSEGRATRIYLRTSGPGYQTQTGEAGIYPQQWLSVIRFDYVVYYVTEYVPGTDAGESYRWRGWYTTGRPGNVADMIYVDFTMPNGVAWITDKGDYRNFTASFFVDIQRIDDAGNPVGTLHRNTVNISGATSTARRVTQKYPAPDGAARYRVRVARSNNRDQRASKELSAAVLASIRARLWHPPGTQAYENCTLIVMQFTASAALNAAQNRRVKVDCTRTLYNVQNGLWGATTNPGDAIFDAFSNAGYGAMRPESEFDFARFRALMPQWGTTNGFNGIFDSETTLIDAMQAILAPVKALPLPQGKLLSVVQDAPRARSYAFGDDTIVKDSLTIAYLFDGENQPDCLAIVYNDPATWAEKRVYYPSEGVRPDVIELFGCTSESHALAWGKLTWQQRQANRKRVTLELEGEGYLLDPLDRFGVTVTATGHGAAGRCIQYDQATAEMLCDCDVPPNTVQCAFIGADGKLSAPFSAVPVSDFRTVRLSGAPWVPHNANELGDATNFVLLHDASQFYEFSVTDLATSTELRVQATGQQYSDAAYAGTFVEGWTTGE